ncbi:MAG: hypothetical protein C0507_13205 [Cyanobacteria bacterium PR.3.49]|nr:hypothetical protein [Cyanobacteria bacterium PR.3.49]
MTRRAEVESTEGSQAAGDNKALLNSVYSDIGYDFLRSLGGTDTISRGATDLRGAAYLDCSIPIVGYESTCASARAEVARVRSESAIPTAESLLVKTDYPAPRVGAEAPRVGPEAPLVRTEAPVAPVTDRPMEIRNFKGDVGLRYTTRSSSGISTADTDHLGVVRALTFEDKDGKRVAVSGERLARIMSSSASGMTAIGWRVDHSGTGVGRTTFITTPDGRTSFQLDHKGRLMGEVGTHEVAAPPSVVRTETPDGVRYETPGVAGETRTAMTDRSGSLSRITVRSATGDKAFELTPENWAAARPNQALNLGGGWTALRGFFGDKFHYDSIRISHTDGTTYMLSATGNRLSFADNPIDFGPRTARVRR